MKDFDKFAKIVLSQKDIWNSLCQDTKPVILYGMGDGADKIISALDMYGIPVADIFASDEFVRGHSFHGHKVLKYSDICEKYEDANILVCFAARTDELFMRFSEIGKRHTLYAPDVPVKGGGLFTLEYFAENKSAFKSAYELLSDDESKAVFENLILYKISGKTEYLAKAESDRNAALSNILKLSASERYLDLGAYTGDTVDELLAVCGGYDAVLACEPDLRSYNKLYSKLLGMENSSAVNCGIGKCDETVMFSNKAGRMSSVGQQQGRETPFMSIDSLCFKNSFSPTYIKMDLEGEERAALEGAKNTLQNKPKLLVSAYHRNCDLFDLPLLIHSLNPEYKIYMRKHKYIPAWDINLYAI